MTISGKTAALFMGLAAAVPAAAQQVVTSPHPESVSVTVYRDPDGGEMDLNWLGGYALITETRTVSLPAGASVIRFEGVAGNILPVSAIIRGLPRDAAEKNYDARLLSAGALVDASLGRQVHVRRTDRATGEVTETEAIIRSGPDGIVLQTPEGIEALRCTGLPETLVYREAPPGLSAKPTLAITTSTDAPATATLQLSYLAGQFDWRANYVATIAQDGRTLDLFAWLTLANANEESFTDAGAQAVAGKPNRDEDEERGATPVSPSISLNCWQVGTTSDIPYRPPPPGAPPGEYDMSEGEIVVTASRMERAAFDQPAPVTVVTAELEQLGDLKLYRIPVPVTIAANAQKQVALLHRERVRFERLYGIWLNATSYREEGDEPKNASILLRTKNVEARGLGRPLPSGTVAVFEQVAGQPMLAGEALINDTPVGQDVEIAVGESPDILVVQRRMPSNAVGTDDEDDDHDEGRSRRYEVSISNASLAAATVEVKLHFYGDNHRLAKPSRKLSLKNGVQVWRARVPARGTASLAYTVEQIPVRNQHEGEEED